MARGEATRIETQMESGKQKEENEEKWLMSVIVQKYNMQWLQYVLHDEHFNL